MSYKYFIGIDIAKDFFDVALHGMPCSAQRFDNAPEGFTAFCEAFARELPEALIVLEATGGYETALLADLCGRRIAVHRVQPLTARHYMRSLRAFGKTDRIDALALARYGAERHDSLPLFVPCARVLEDLRDLHSRRRDLLAMRIAEQQRLKHPRYRNLTQSVETMLNAIKAEISRIEEAMCALVEGSENLRARYKVLTAFPGIGGTTALCLLAEMPELGTLTRRQAASLAGLAPHPSDSGNHAGYRSIRGGRASVRKALFMAALAARQHNPSLRAFYLRLIQNGKKPMVAITALMRKMIVILNARMRDALGDQAAKTW